MAAAIKKEILEDEERQQRRSAERQGLEKIVQEEKTKNGDDVEMMEPNENGHNNYNKANQDTEQEEAEDTPDDFRQQELRAHLFLASVTSSHQNHHHHQQHQATPDLFPVTENAQNPSFHVPCPLCQVPLEQRIFRQHLDRHYPRDSPVCPVIQCRRRFAHPNSVRNHMRLKHAVQWLKMKAMRSSGGPFVGSSNGHTTPA